MLTIFGKSKFREISAKVLHAMVADDAAMARDKCAAARAMVDTHLSGRFGARMSVGLPVARQIAGEFHTQTAIFRGW